MPQEARTSPRHPRARRTVDTIVEAAAQLLEEGGFEGYNTNAIAARASVSVGSLYRYFHGKDAITAALIEREGESLIAATAAARRDPGAREALIHLIDAAVAHRLFRPELARAIDRAEARTTGEPNDRASATTLERLALAALGRPGLARTGKLDVAASDLVAILNAMVDAAAARGEEDSAAIARRVRAAVFGYLDRAQTA